MDVASQTEIGRVQDLVGGRVVENGLGVDTSLVGKGAETGDRVVERSVDLYCVGDQVFELLDLVQLVLALDVVGAGDHHAGQEATKRGNAVPLANCVKG